MCIYFITREKGDDIIENQINIISRIKKLNDDYSSIINELTMMNNLLSTINTKSNSCQNPQQGFNDKFVEIKKKLDEIQGKLDDNKTFLQEKFRSDSNKSHIIGTFVIGHSLLKLQNAPLDMTCIITIVLILIVSALTVLPLFFIPEDTMAIVYQRGYCDTHIHLGIIPIFLALAGIWSLAFMYIKSRLKTHEQDSTFLRKRLEQQIETRS